MVNYPIRVASSFYRGSDPKKVAKAQEHNRLAIILQKHINEQIERKGGGTFLYHNIAYDLNLPVEIVREILYAVDCGHNGFTVAPTNQPPVT